LQRPTRGIEPGLLLDEIVKRFEHGALQNADVGVRD
jgi:hypothetical protein